MSDPHSCQFQYTGVKYWVLPFTMPGSGARPDHLAVLNDGELPDGRECIVCLSDTHEADKLEAQAARDAAFVLDDDELTFVEHALRRHPGGCAVVEDIPGLQKRVVARFTEALKRRKEPPDAR